VPIACRFACIVLVLCLFPPRPATALSVAIGEYLPGLNPGNAWQYDAAARFGPSEAYTPATMSLSIGTPISVHGTVATPVERTSNLPFDVGDSRTFSFDAGGLRLHREDFDLTATNFETPPAPVSLLPASVDVGQSYPFAYNFTGQAPADNDAWSGSLNGTIQIAGFESVTVPAGTYNALKLVYSTAWSESGNANGSAYSGSGGLTQTWWLAQHIGIVKLGSLNTNNYGEPDSYIQFNAELTSFALVLPGDTDNDGDVDDADLGNAFSNYTGPLSGAGNKTAADGDTDGDGDVDDADLGTAFANYTGPLNAAPASVPEPASLITLGVGGLFVVRRRR
jgi:hypothetical protein